MLGLVLHASHEQEPEKVFVLVVSAGLDLVIDEAHLRVFLVSDLVFMVSYQDNSRVEAGDQLADYPPDQILSKNIQAGVVGQDKNTFELNKLIITMLMDLRAATSESNLHLR